MNKKPAYSLIFAFIMMTVIMVIATTTIQDTRNKIQIFGNLEATSQARLAAESAAELGIVALKEADGYTAESEEEAFCLEYNTSSHCQSEAVYTIYPYATENDEDGNGYYIPIPNTGNAGTSEDCSILNEHVTIDHACNWNKLTTGNSVTIPMYYDDGTGTLSYPGSLGLTGWYLKLRTPCENGSLSDDCDGGDRYEFLSDSDDATTDDPLIAYWQLDYELSDGTISSLFPNQETLYVDPIYYRYGDNNEIDEYTINQGLSSDFIALEADTSTNNGDPYDTTTESTIVDLYLTITIIGSLVDDAGSAIPYLEWQVEWNATTPIIAPTSMIVGEGYYESGGDTYYHPYSISYSSIGNVTSVYTLSN